MNKTVNTDRIAAANLLLFVFVSWLYSYRSMEGLHGLWFVLYSGIILMGAGVAVFACSNEQVQGFAQSVKNLIFHERLSRPGIIPAAYLILSAFFMMLSVNLWQKTIESVRNTTASGNELFAGIICLAVGFYGLFSVRLLSGNTGKSYFKLMISWQKLLYITAFYCAVINFSYNALSFSVYTAPVIRILHTLLFGWLFFINAEITVYYIRTLAGHMREDGTRADIPALFFVSALTLHTHPLKSIHQACVEHFGVNLSASESLKYVVSFSETLVIGGVFIFWLLTSVVIVPPTQRAIILKWGEIPERKDYGPGIHFKYPWPVEKAVFHPAYAVKSMNIGFVPDPNQKNIIWTRSHAAENFNLIAGNGTEILSADLQVMFRIHDLYSYLYSWQNADDALNVFSYRALLNETISATFDEIMVRDRSRFSSVLKEKIQQQLDNENCGIEVVDVIFLALHPPIEISESYEDVISARINRETQILQARTNTHYVLSEAVSESLSLTRKAESYAETKVSVTRGESSAFIDRLKGFNRSPDTVEFRLKMEIFETAFWNKKLYILDSSLLRSQDTLFFNTANSPGGM